MPKRERQKAAKKAAQSKARRPGQPTKYRPQFCDRLIAFFDVEPWEERKVEHYHPNGKLHWTEIKRLPNRMPTLRAFAKTIGVSVATLYNWMNEKHRSYQPAFAQAFIEAKELHKEWLIDLTPPLAFKFVAINLTDMRDQQNIEVGGSVKIILEDDEE